MGAVSNSRLVNQNPRAGAHKPVYDTAGCLRLHLEPFRPVTIVGDSPLPGVMTTLTITPLILDADVILIAGQPHPLYCAHRCSRVKRQALALGDLTQRCQKTLDIEGSPSLELRHVRTWALHVPHVGYCRRVDMNRYSQR